MDESLITARRALDSALFLAGRTDPPHAVQRVAPRRAGVRRGAAAVESAVAAAAASALCYDERGTHNTRRRCEKHSEQIAATRVNSGQNNKKCTALHSPPRLLHSPLIHRSTLGPVNRYVRRGGGGGKGGGVVVLRTTRGHLCTCPAAAAGGRQAAGRECRVSADALHAPDIMNDRQIPLRLALRSFVVW